MIVCAVFRGLDVSLIAGLRHGEVACVLKFEDLVAPAGPSGLEVSGEKLQALGFSADVGPQHVCVDEEGKERGSVAGFSLIHLYPSNYSGVSPASNPDEFTASRKQVRALASCPAPSHPSRRLPRHEAAGDLETVSDIPRAAHLTDSFHFLWPPRYPACSCACAPHPGNSASANISGGINEHKGLEPRSHPACATCSAELSFPARQRVAEWKGQTRSSPTGSTLSGDSILKGELGIKI